MELFKLWGSVLINSDEANNSLHNTQLESQKTADKFKEMAGEAGGVGGKITGAFDSVSGLLKDCGINIDANVLKWATYGAAGVAACAAIGAKLFEITKNTASYGDEIDKTSQKLGVNAEQYQVLAYAADHSGISMEKFNAAASKVAQMENFEGNLYTYIESLQDIADPAERTAKAVKDLGAETAMQIQPLINGTAAMSDYQDQLESLGGIMSNESVADSALFMDTLTDIQKGFAGIGATLGSNLMPIFQKLLNWVVEQMPTIASISEKVFGAITTAVEFVTPVIELLLDSIGAVLTVTDMVFNALEPIIRPVVDTITDIINGLIEVINTLSFGLINLNKVGSDYDYDAFEKRTASTVEYTSGLYDENGVLIERFANGGVVNSRMAIVGENGPELLDMSGSKPVVTNAATSGIANISINVNMDEISDVYDLVRIAKEAQLLARMG